MAQSSDVSVALQPDAATVALAGRPVGYMLVVGNAGRSTATGVEVSLSTSNLTQIQVSGDCRALPCLIDSLEVGHASIYVHAIVAADGGFALSAHAAARQPDPDTDNNTAQVSVSPPSKPVPIIPNPPAGVSVSPTPVDRSADVSISLQPLGRPQARAGQVTSYALVVSNAGPSVATGVRILSSSANLTDAEVSGACSRLPCVIEALRAGATDEIDLRETVLAGGSFRLTARAKARQTDPDIQNNVGSVTVSPPPPVPPWLPIVGVALAVLAGGGKATRDRRRRARWLRLLSLEAHRGTGEGLAPGPLSFTAPALTLDARCMAGRSGPCGPVPVLKVELRHG